MEGLLTTNINILFSTAPVVLAFSVCVYINIPCMCVCVHVCTQRVIADWIYEAEYVIELLTYLSVTSNKQIVFADNT